MEIASGHERNTARAAWTAFSVFLGGALASGGLGPVALAAILLGLAAGASKSRWIQERVRFLTTDKQRLKRFYDSCYELRGEFVRQRKAGDMEEWDAWAERLRGWDKPFLKYLQGNRDDWRPLWRKVHSPLDRGYANWDDITMKSIDERLGLIETLLRE